MRGLSGPKTMDDDASPRDLLSESNKKEDNGPFVILRQKRVIRYDT